MNSFPLIRKPGSNETAMSNLFMVTLLYFLPGWISKPDKILQFFVVLAVALITDTLINFNRFKKPVCSVSAAVTASLLQILTPAVPLWGLIPGVAVSLTIGKHLWGGTGKNIFNPAIIGVFFLTFFYNIKVQQFSGSPLIIAAMIISAPFIHHRPFASIGWMAGMTAALFTNQPFTPISLVSYGVLFFGSLIITDPVTITAKPVTGLIFGLVFGFFSVYLSSNLQYLTGAILTFNLLSYLFDKTPLFQDLKLPVRLKIKPPIPFDNYNEIIDLTKQNISPETRFPEPQSPSEILNAIRDKAVFGCGGGGFPASVKIETVLNSSAPDKFFIINAVECDPGLIHDKILLGKYPDKIRMGISLISRIIPFKKIILAVKDNLIDFNTDKNIEIFKSFPFYPAGSERALIKQILNRKIQSKEIPAELGILVLNVQTVLAITEAVIENRKAVTKYITVANFKQKQNTVVRASLGDKVSDIINKVYPDGYPVFYGGGIMLARQADEDSVIDKSTSIIAISDFTSFKESPQCSHCGSCMKYCPEHLEVNRIADSIDRNKITSTHKFAPERCVSCGICSYICPAGRNLMRRVQTAAESLQNA